MKDGVLAYAYNFLGVERYTVSSSEKLKSGNHEVKIDFAYDGGGVGKGGIATLYIDGEQVGQGSIGRTQPGIFSVDEGLMLVLIWQPLLMKELVLSTNQNLMEAYLN